jgi:hypothetical protein
MQWDLLELLVTTVVVDLFGPEMFLQQTVLMELVGSKVAAHFRAVLTQIFKLAVVAVDQEVTVLTQFHLMAELAELAFQVL